VPAPRFSDGEIFLARLAGIPANKILFTGNSKTDAELRYAVDAGTMVSVDSHDELIALSRISSAAGKEIKIAFRVNPDVDARAHPKLATGLAKSKFGIPGEQIVSISGRRRTCPG
jgi:diaminopimelate decarboxylase